MSFVAHWFIDIITRTLQPMLKPIIEDQALMAQTLCKIERFIKLPQPYYTPPHATTKRIAKNGSTAQRFLDFGKES